MNKILTTALLLTTLITTASAKDYSLTLSDPDKAATIDVEVRAGSISVIGYEGKTIEISSITEPLRNIREDNIDHYNYDDNDEDTKKHRRSIKGLKKIKNQSTPIEIEEHDNQVEITSETSNQAVNLIIKVPYKSNLELDVYKSGDIKVTNVSGTLELDNHKGIIFAEGISGPIVAETHNNDIEVSFKSLNQSQPSSLTSRDGSIDISLPKTFKANVKVQTYKGEIYSGINDAFKLDNSINHDKKESHQRITLGGIMTATVNGGGQVLSINTYRGDIYVRKK